jgi:hypothetical protein
MGITPATLFGTEMAKLTGNVGGNIQQLLETYISGGRVRGIVANIPLAGQANGSVIGIARLPTPFNLVGIVGLTDTSLGTATIALGNAADGKSAIYKAAATFTATNTPTLWGLASSLGVPVITGYDCLTGAPTSYANAGNGGGGYEDIVMTVAAADLPGAGKLRIFFEYMID